MTLLFLSPHFPPQYRHFCIALVEQGIRVVGIGEAPAEELPGELTRALSAYTHVPDMAALPMVLEAAMVLSQRFGPLSRIESLNEHWLWLEAALRERLELAGPRPDEVRRWQSKSAMRELFRSAGVPSTSGIRAESRAELEAFAATVGLPLVVKPDIGVGAARTFRIDTPEELRALLSTDVRGFVVERFEPGGITSFDGLVDGRGRIVFSTSHRYSAGVMEVVNHAKTVSYHSRRTIPPELERLGRRIVEAYGLKERFFHIEFFEQDGAFRALEANFRPPGGFTTDLMNWACDVDVYALWARMVAGESLQGFRYERRFHAAHVGRRDARRYIVPSAEAAARLGSSLMWHGRMPRVFAGAMGDEAFLFREADESRLLTLIANLSAERE